MDCLLSCCQTVNLQTVSWAFSCLSAVEFDGWFFLPVPTEQTLQNTERARALLVTPVALRVRSGRRQAGIISAKAAGDARFTDTRADEQERGVTIKSTGDSDLGGRNGLKGGGDMEGLERKEPLQKKEGTILHHKRSLVIRK